jgi:2-polyprenyl-3-methyl-5-hydroxy-6-metoxy-1,4-benzoquinol methylase
VDTDPAIASRDKPASYYQLERSDLVAELPTPIGRALDVGCGEGGVGRSLRAAGATEVHGVELFESAAVRARESLDSVISGSVEEALASGALHGPFDTICCYDVLEHLVDPHRVLVALRGLAATGGRLHISIPNARHFSLILDLVFRGTFGYREWGHRDSTHLRWYTRRDLMALVESAGWSVEWTRSPAFAGLDRYLDRATLGTTREFNTLQWHLLAHRR